MTQRRKALLIAIQALILIPLPLVGSWLYEQMPKGSALREGVTMSCVFLGMFLLVGIVGVGVGVETKD